MPGLPELLVILLIVLVVFGANKLPGIGDALGRSIRNFKRAQGGAEEADDEEEVEKPVRKKLPAQRKQIALEPAREDEPEAEAEAEDEDEDEVTTSGKRWSWRRRKKKPGRRARVASA